jgi:6-pyruvoyltetrahydropterin/6-carboxytetrahydropterin synthase
VSFSVRRYHDICAGHRVHGHEGKCQHLHGHNYRIHFECAARNLDQVGRVLDFSVIKSRLCQWLEDNWDHRFIVWVDDPIAESLSKIDPTIVRVPFNPTAENMAHHLVTRIGPLQLEGTGVWLVSVVVEETAKCSAVYEAGG